MSILFEPMRLGNIQIKNRFVHSATYEAMATKAGKATENLVKRYRKLAQGGVGLVIPGYLYVHPLGRSVEHQTGIHSDDMIPGLKRIVKAVHQQDAKIVFQLAHAGRQTKKSIIGQTPMGPSSSHRDLFYFVKPKRMTEEQIHQAIQAFAQATARAVKAGADGIQIHATHGYLVNQFLSPFFNDRDDAWGGSDENRFRFLKQVVLATKRVLPEGSPLLVKLNTNEYTPQKGITPSLAIKYARWLTELGVDGLELSSGTVVYSFMHVYWGSVPVDELAKALPWWQKPLGKIVLKRWAGKFDDLEGFNLKATETIKSAIDHMPVFAVGGLRRVSHMEEILEKGIADFISMSRPFVREPFILKKIKEGKADSVSCVSCNKCLAAVVNGTPIRCYYKKLG